MLLDQSRRYEVWEWLDRLPSDSLQTVVMSHAAELVRLDASRLAIIVANQMPDSLTKIIQKLDGDANLEFVTLGAMHQMIQYKEEDVKMVLTPDLLEKYLELMCKLEPSRVSISSGS